MSHSMGFIGTLEIGGFRLAEAEPESSTLEQPPSGTGS